MLINHVPGEECRIAIVENDRLEELYTERFSADLHVGNIYRGRVTNVEPSIQAAFVDFGLERNGFLHITDLHPKYFNGAAEQSTEKVGRKTPRKERPPIQQCLRRGQQILVQVLKEGIGTKGPTLTSYLSIPGKFLVMMPFMERHGVSRKIDDPEKRNDARKILDELSPPDGFGFIIRTAGFEKSKAELKRDLNYLLRLWKNIEQRMKSGSGPAELAVESDLVIRTLRDVLTSDIKRIIIDDRVAALRAKRFLKLATPRGSTQVIHHNESTPLFDAFGIESQIRTINQRQVALDCGGSLVFDSTEAMVAIDVNSGKFRDNKDSEQTAFKTNQEAVDEIARQLRLRDLGGLIVMDLIDMYQMRHRREIERRFKESLKKDRARTKVLRISELGLLEMTRQRMRPSLKRSVYDPCRACEGLGQVLSSESILLEATRQLALALSHDRVRSVTVTVHPDVIAEMLNRSRNTLVELENRTGKPIRVKADATQKIDQIGFECLDANKGVVDLEKLSSPKKPQFKKEDEISDEDLKELDELIEDKQIETPQEILDESEPKKKKRRRRRRRRRKKSDSASSDQSDASDSDSPDPKPDSKSDASGYVGADGSDAKTDGDSTSDSKRKQSKSKETKKEEESEDGGTAEEPPAKKKRRRRRRSGRSKSTKEGDQKQSTKEASSEEEEKDNDKKTSKSKSSRRRRSKSKSESSSS